MTYFSLNHYIHWVMGQDRCEMGRSAESGNTTMLICGMIPGYRHHASVQQNYRKINCELIIAQNNTVTYLSN
jgi:hypothetical protein